MDFMRFPTLLFLLLVLLSFGGEGKTQVGSLQTDCALGGERDGGSYQFVATCAGRARSPDGRFAIVQRAYREEQPAIELQDAIGRTLAPIPALSDDMPFSVSWAPNSRWFFVNHHVGSFMDTLRVFEIVGRTAVERPALGEAAVRLATTRYPCLPPELVRPNGVRWARDSRRIVLFTISATWACTVFGRRPGTWHSLWMIGDVSSGRIDPRSIVAQSDERPLEMPKKGAYSRF
jgi:hypothetical protein